ncbi:MAG: hypothetical protein RLZZ277_27 [Actinomycetota bacterium]|jgi:NADPH:quinone reductase-like Zn-dependent oxidoreductase
MRALQVKKYGEKNLPVIAEIATPTCGPDELLIKVHAAGLNPLDIKTRDGEFKVFLPYKVPFTLGNDFAGTVTAIGENVSNFAIDDQVFGMANSKQIGTFAEYVVVNKDVVAKKPSNISFTEASVLPLVSLTAWQIFQDAALQPDQKVLIHGGSGGLGATAIQVAKALNLTVATTCSARNVDFVKSLGADEVVDYNSANFEDILNGFDLVIDTVGGKNLSKSMKVLKTGGLLVSLVGPPDVAFARKAGAPLPIQWVMKVLSFGVLRTAKKLGVLYAFHFVRSSGAQLTEIAALIHSGKIKPYIAQTVSFDKSPELFNRQSALSKVAGKTSIAIS